MEVRRNFSTPSFGNIEGDATQIAKKLGKNALNIIMEQKFNNVADIFVNSNGNIRVVARKGHSLEIPYTNKTITDLRIWNVNDEWMNSYANGWTSDGKKVKIGFMTASLDPASEYKGVDKIMLGALRIAKNAFEAVAHSTGKPSILEPSEAGIVKAVESLINLEV